MTPDLHPVPGTPGIHVTDNGDHYLRLTSDSDPANKLYVPLTEWLALVAQIGAGLVPGWASPAALQQGYNELLATYEVAYAQLDQAHAELAGLKQLLGETAPDDRRYPCITCGKPASPDQRHCPTCKPCAYCTQCGRPLPAQDTAAGRQVCRECGKPCPSCCTEIGERFGPVDCVTCGGTGAVVKDAWDRLDDAMRPILRTNLPTEPELEAGETEGPDIVPAAGGEGL
jgi:hypothetical protein